MRAPGNDALEGFRQPTDLVAAQLVPARRAVFRSLRAT